MRIGMYLMIPTYLGTYPLHQLLCGGLFVPVALFDVCACCAWLPLSLLVRETDRFYAFVLYFCVKIV